MNKKQFDKLEKQLLDRGYKKYNQHWHHEDYVIGKSFHRGDNQWDEDRAGYQLLLSIYDYTLHPEMEKVGKYTSNGELVKVYDSIVLAGLDSGISGYTISNCVCGYIKTAGGFYWKYIN